MRDYQKLEVWQLGMDIADQVFDLFDAIPLQQVGFKIRDQATDAACSVPSNIAEGSAHRSEKQKYHYLEIALGSPSNCRHASSSCNVASGYPMERWRRYWPTSNWSRRRSPPSCPNSEADALPNVEAPLLSQWPEANGQWRIQLLEFSQTLVSTPSFFKHLIEFAFTPSGGFMERLFLKLLIAASLFPAIM